jgi:rhodanese-related sulfurtransferase
MPGSWTLTVKVTRSGKTVSARFTVDARWAQGLENSWKEVVNMRFKLIAASGIALILFGMPLFTAAGESEQVPRLAKEELRDMLGKPDVIAIDVRLKEQWDSSSVKIAGAQREDPGKKAGSWALKYPKDKTIVLYWSWHNEATSARVAQEMISLGFKRVYVLKGGWNEWLAAGYLCLIAGVILTIPTTLTSWATWKSKYKGAQTKIFKTKIILSYFMLIVGTLMILFRAYFVIGEHTIWHFVFAFGFVALFFASRMEGYYSGRLNYR